MTGPVLESGAKMRYIEDGKASRGTGKCSIGRSEATRKPSPGVMSTRRWAPEEYNPL